MACKLLHGSGDFFCESSSPSSRSEITRDPSSISVAVDSQHDQYTSNPHDHVRPNSSRLWNRSGTLADPSLGRDDGHVIEVLERLRWRASRARVMLHAESIKLSVTGADTVSL